MFYNSNLEILSWTLECLLHYQKNTATLVTPGDTDHTILCQGPLSTTAGGAIYIDHGAPGIVRLRSPLKSFNFGIVFHVLVEQNVFLNNSFPNF